MSEIRILQLIDGLNIGGAEMTLLELSKGLKERGFQVHIGYSTPGSLADILVERGFDITHLPRLMRIDLLLFWNTLKLIKRVRPHIVHTHLFKSDFHGRLAARLTGVPVVVSTLHSTDRWARKFPLGALYGWTAKFTDQIIAVSDDLRSFHQEHTGVPEEKFITIENGVDLVRHTFSDMARKKVRKEFSIEESLLLFGIIGRLTPPKDHDTFLQAAAIIKQEAPDARFLIVGDGPLREKLEDRARELALLPNLQFTGFRDDIPEIMSALDILVFSSQWEGLPVTLLEGLAASRTVVATDVGGIPAVVQDGKEALLVPPINPDALARACLQLASDTELRLSLGQAGLTRVTSAYSISSMIDRTVSLYKTLLTKKGLEQLLSTQEKELVV
ncbi:MAG: glycosyltransferase [Anaerolineae bacterium]|nr:glycosyltransferase [Anaerolineae bacterium]MBT7188770.1 glycosyltransferase [Anaerolineae bacterium]MBT7600567.1 glycosyltransferase [Anaerolineae bacterium]MBT7988751.1 glycosyltransferase [Anaerolineae bacterium]